MYNPLKIIDNLAQMVAVKLYRGFYEGGKITKANKDFWNATSSFEETAQPDRDRLRARARWLSGNNAIMDNIDNAIINNVVGKGIYLQSVTGKQKFDDNVELNWLRWCKNKNICDITGRFNFFVIQRMLIKSRIVDGEIFIYKIITKDGLKLQLIETDALDSSRSDGGIETDTYGKPVNYHFIDSTNKAYSIKASSIIHYFLPERPTQYRGLSEYKQAILDIKNFSAFQSASIQGARARANIAYAVKNTGSGNALGADINTKIQSVNGVSVLYLNKGETIEKLDPDSVATDYAQFSEATIRSIATARKVSYELAFRDYSRVNFASSRASLLQDNKRFDFEQEDFVLNVLNDIFEAWFEVEVLRGTISAPSYEKDPSKYCRPKWIMPKRDLVDPLKEITAIEKKLKLNLTSEIDVANSEGEDYEEILRKKAKENELKLKYGLPLDENMQNIGNDVNSKGEPKSYDTNMTGSEKK